MLCLQAILIIVLSFTSISRSSDGRKTAFLALPTSLTHQPGDTVGSYSLVEKINLLGLEEMYEVQYHWQTANRLQSLRGPPNDSLIVQADRDPCTEEFCIRDNIFHGGHGDVWRARRPNNPDESYILKRMRTKNRPDILHCAQREIHFGQFLHNNPRYPRLVTYFIENDDYWLVFEDEGVSLLGLLYAVDNSQPRSVGLLKPSKIWQKMRTSASGHASMKGLMYEIISNAHALHQAGVLHRDIKPSNILLNVHNNQPRVLLADFSSAVSLESKTAIQDLYGPLGPSVYESTLLYAPPEVLLNLSVDYFAKSPAEMDSSTSSLPFHQSRPQSYDIWSIGVVFLELILGTADVFSVDQRSAALMAQKLQQQRRHLADSVGEFQNLYRKALLMASLADYCIFSRPLLELDQHKEGNSAKPHRRDSTRYSDEISSIGLRILAELSSTKTEDGVHRMFRAQDSRLCSEKEFAQALLRRDPLGKGFQDTWGLDLLRRLLHFDPLQRIALSDALTHAFFRGPYRSLYDQSEHAIASERDRYDQEFILVHASTVEMEDDHPSIEGLGSLVQRADLAPPVALDMHFPLTMLLQSHFEDMDIVETEHFNVDEHTPETFPKLSVDAIIDQIAFACPKCKRVFSGDWKACHRHVMSRKHGRHCVYRWDDQVGEALVEYNDGITYDSTSMYKFDDETVRDVAIIQRNAAFLAQAMPSCLSQHDLLPIDEEIGWCDLQGRRIYVEDLHAIHFGNGYIFTGVFDGHFGSFAARYSAAEIHSILMNRFHDMRTADLSSEPADKLKDSIFHGHKIASSSSYMESPMLKWEKLKSEIFQGKEVLRTANADLVAAVGDDWIDNLVPKSDDTVFALSTCDIANQGDFTGNALIQFDPTPCLAFRSVDDDVWQHNRTMVTAAALENALIDAFLTTNQELLIHPSVSADIPSSINVDKESPNFQLSQFYIGGTTASTVLLLPARYVAIASVGDSRVVACCYFHGDDRTWEGYAVQFSVDHVPTIPKEYHRIITRGGFVQKDESSESSSTLRVNGKLAVTRALGDPKLAPFLLAAPDVLIMKLPRLSQRGTTYGSINPDYLSKGLCADLFLNTVNGHPPRKGFYPLFAVVGSDGLWDVMSNEDTIEIVCGHLVAALVTEPREREDDIDNNRSLFQYISRHLSQEALIRGSSDNIGVSVIDFRL